MADKRYIDADKLTFSRVRIIHSDGTIGGWHAVVMSSVIKDAPAADVVEVVRCCDCKYCETVIHSVIDEPKWFCTRMVRAFDVDPTSFCSYGERKEQT